MLKHSQFITKNGATEVRDWRVRPSGERQRVNLPDGL